MADVAEAVVAPRPRHDMARFVAVLNSYLAAGPWYMRVFFRAAARLVHVYPILRFGKRWRSLDALERERVLWALDEHGTYLVRGTFKMFKAVVFMVYYADPRNLVSLGIPPVGALDDGVVSRLAAAAARDRKVLS